MAKSNNLKDFLTDVADAIRSKTGEAGLINPQDFSARIASIQTGGGVAINNQDKSIDIVENGTTEVVADAGFTGLGKVVINANVVAGGGGSDMPVIGDGKTYLYIEIEAAGMMNVPLRFSQTVSNGVTIDWGDGSTTQTMSGTGNKTVTHTYAAIGKYVISLDVAEGCTLGLGHNDSSYCVMGNANNSGVIYCNMLKAIEIGSNVPSINACAFYYCRSLSNVVIPNGVTSIGGSAFYRCYSLSSVVIPSSVTSIGGNAFYQCYSLSSIVIPQGVTSIGNYAFNGCHLFSKIVIPNSVTSIGNYAFGDCYGMAFYDFSQATVVPSLGTYVFNSIQSGRKIIVPDALYDEWKAATNWSSYASYIIKDSAYIR